MTCETSTRLPTVRPRRKAPASWRRRPRLSSSANVEFQRRRRQISRWSGTTNSRIVRRMENVMQLLQIADDAALRLPKPRGMLMPPVVVPFHGEAIDRPVKTGAALPLGAEYRRHD